MLVDGEGTPLSLVVTGANQHDVSPLETLLGSFVISRPYIFERPQYLCLDKGYYGEPALEIRDSSPHIKITGRRKRTMVNIKLAAGL
jgi:hypothetical protein